MMFSRKGKLAISILCMRLPPRLRVSFIASEKMSTSNSTNENYFIEGINGPGFAVAVGIELILAIIPNLFILLYTLCHYKILKQPSMIFLTGLALVNLLIPILFLPFTAITAATGEWIFGETDEQRDGVCQFVGFVFSVAVTLTFHMLALISVDRFILIVKPFIYRAYMKPWVAYLLVAVAGVLGILQNVAPFAGLGDIDFASFVASCLPLWVFTDYVIYYTVLTLAPVAIIVVTTLWTFCFTRKFIRKDRDQRLASATSITVQEEYRDIYTRRVCNLVGIFGMMLIILVASIIPFVLANIAIVFVGLNNVPIPLYGAAFIIFFSSYAAYPIIQAYFRRDLQSAIHRGLQRIKVCKTSTISGEKTVPSNHATTNSVNTVIDV